MAVSGQPHAHPPRKRPGAHFTGSWVGPKDGPDVCGKSPPPPCGIRSPDRAARSQLLYRLSYTGLICINMYLINLFIFTRNSSTSPTAGAGACSHKIRHTQPVRLPKTSDRPVGEACTCTAHKNSKRKTLMSQRHLNSRSQHSSGRRFTR
jgi:hypothetical protein